MALTTPPLRTGMRLLPRLLLIGAALVLLVLAIVFLRRWLGEPVAPVRQVARIALLPDTPPPPPPPPKERKDEPPKPDKAPVPTPESPVKPPPAAPVNEALKMEGAAGNGPSAFAAGAVTKDYQGGAPVIGAAASAGGRGLDRAQERLYAGSVRQALRDELERQLPAEAGELSASFALWIGADGRLSRWELEGDGGGHEPATALRQALGRSAERLQLPAPEGISQPLRFRLTLRQGA